MLINSTTSSIELQAKLFRGFADPSRLSILEALRDGERTVSDLVQTTGLTQPNVSNHLSCLRDCGLVTVRQQGRFAYYSLSDERVAQLLQLGDELLAEVLLNVDKLRPGGTAWLMPQINQWRRYDDNRRRKMESALKRVAGTEGISRALYENVHGALGPSADDPGHSVD